jgi:hypothetical protein
VAEPTDLALKMAIQQGKDVLAGGAGSVRLRTYEADGHREVVVMSTGGLVLCTIMVDSVKGYDPRVRAMAPATEVEVSKQDESWSGVDRSTSPVRMAGLAAWLPELDSFREHDSPDPYEWRLARYAQSTVDMMSRTSNGEPILADEQQTEEERERERKRRREEAQRLREERVTLEPIRNLPDNPNGADWESVFEYARPPEVIVGAEHVDQSPFKRINVKEIIGLALGENDGPDWLLVGRLKDGRFAFIKAGCDYTGWG